MREALVLIAAGVALAACQTPRACRSWVCYEPNPKVCAATADASKGNADVIVDMRPEGGCSIAHMPI